MLYSYAIDRLSDEKFNSNPKVRIEETDDLDLLVFICELPLTEVRRRLANDHRAYVAFYNERPAAFGWMAMGKALVGELNHEMILPIGHRYLWNFRTLVQYRGLGIYPILLAFIMRHTDPGARHLWIMHAPENEASRRGILKAGFTYAGTVSILQNNPIISDVNEEQMMLVEEFDSSILKSFHPGATCWVCSSPYLIHKKKECCCVKEERRCNAELFV